MAFLSFILFAFLGICAMVACFRSGKVIIKAINHLFDFFERKL